jgi:hypothetical protein
VRTRQALTEPLAGMAASLRARAGDAAGVRTRVQAAMAALHEGSEADA